jgi:hypothetical protein
MFNEEMQQARTGADCLLGPREYILISAPLGTTRDFCFRNTPSTSGLLPYMHMTIAILLAIQMAQLASVSFVSCIIVACPFHLNAQLASLATTEAVRVPTKAFLSTHRKRLPNLKPKTLVSCVYWFVRITPPQTRIGLPEELLHETSARIAPQVQRWRLWEPRSLGSSKAKGRLCR